MTGDGDFLFPVPEHATQVGGDVVVGVDGDDAPELDAEADVDGVDELFAEVELLEDLFDVTGTVSVLDIGEKELLVCLVHAFELPGALYHHEKVAQDAAPECFENGGGVRLLAPDAFKDGLGVDVPSDQEDLEGGDVDIATEFAIRNEMRVEIVERGGDVLGEKEVENPLS